MGADRIVCGRHAAKAALGTGRLRKLWLATDTNRDLAVKAAKQGIRVEQIGVRKLSQLAGTENHQGVVAQAFELVQVGWRAAIEQVTTPLIVVLDQVQDPRNLGACLRTAAAMGANALVHPKRNSVGLTPAARKVAAGAEEFVTIEAVSNIARQLQAMAELGLQVVGTVADSGTNINELDLSGPVALVLGGEAKGLRELTQRNCNVLATIPMTGAKAVASLNVAVACGICLAAVVRARCD